MALPPLDTQRLAIRRWRSEQVNSFHDIWGDPEVIWWGASDDVDASRALMERVVDMGPGLGWGAVTETTTGTVVGNVALQPTPGDRTDIEVGWHLARAHWGCGFATEAARAVVEHAFTTLSLQRVVADIVPANQRSRDVATRLGMEVKETTERLDLVHDVWVLEAPLAAGD